MSKDFSTYLDFLRGLAAVMVFFVISGYIIAYVANTKETAPRVFALKRISRIYSVLIPSAAIAIICFLLTGPGHPIWCL